MDLTERLAKERRSRLAAEHLLEQMQRELFAANQKLAIHARALSDQIVVQRSATQEALSEAAVLKGQNASFVAELDAAHTLAVMAERRMWDSIDTIRDGFAVYDSAQQLVVANRAYTNAFDAADVRPGMPYHAILERCLSRDLVQLQGESGHAWHSRMLARWEQEVISPEVISLSDGRYLRLLERRGRDGDIVCLAIDITEEMRVWSAIEAIPDGFVLFDREDRMLTCNQRFRALYKESSQAIQPGASYEEILRYGLAQDQFSDATGRDEDWLAERMQYHRSPSGSLEERLIGDRWMRVLEQMTPDGGRVGLRVDITELKAQQAALEAARAAAEAATRAKSAFLANMSHEIRTPMNGVVGMAELLCETALTQEQRLFADTIRSSGEALLVIINDILDYSRIEAERLTLHSETFDLERLIHEVTMLLQPRARAKDVAILLDFDMFLPTQFVGDPVRLRQVFTNLMGNAVKFTETGHVLIRVVGVESDGGGQQLHITVEDTGIGISPENIDHIFGEFNQVDSDQNRRFEGTGLGLAITHRLIEMMGGKVWVESELGRGSCFGLQLALPLAEVNEPSDLPIFLRRALVVDAEFTNRTILDRQLSAHGIDVTTCRSCMEALNLLQQDPAFDLVLADHDMPVMSGIEFARQLRATGSELPIMLMSSNPVAAREQGDELGLAAILQKPIIRSAIYRSLQLLGEPLASSRISVVQGKGRRMRVLAAEDNRTNRLVFAKMVQDFAIELKFAENGFGAVETFRSWSPDLIFMDISMPEMDGRAASQAIRALECEDGHVPIIALTAHAMEGDRTDILAAGLDRYMTKPLRKAAILAILAEFCPPDATPPDGGAVVGDLLQAGL